MKVTMAYIAISLLYALTMMAIIYLCTFEEAVLYLLSLVGGISLAGALRY